MSRPFSTHRAIAIGRSRTDLRLESETEVATSSLSSPQCIILANPSPLPIQNLPKLSPILKSDRNLERQ
ncbi:MAG: hypothetical protein ACP5D7_18090 [Limnospira sp.]